MEATVSEVLKYLHQTPEFNTLRQVRESLRKTPHVNSLITQFQKKQEAFYTGSIPQDQAQYLADELNRDYENLIKNPDIRRYFVASENFSALLNNFIDRINSALAKDLR